MRAGGGTRGDRGSRGRAEASVRCVGRLGRRCRRLRSGTGRAHRGCACACVDERLSTVTAANHLREGGLDSRPQRSVIDQAAAVVILQQFLDRRRVTLVKPTAGRNAGKTLLARRRRRRRPPGPPATFPSYGHPGQRRAPARARPVRPDAPAHRPPSVPPAPRAAAPAEPRPAVCGASSGVIERDPDETGPVEPKQWAHRGSGDPTPEHGPARGDGPAAAWSGHASAWLRRRAGTTPLLPSRPAPPGAWSRLRPRQAGAPTTTRPRRTRLW